MTNEQLLQKWIDITTTYTDISEGLDANMVELKEDTNHFTFGQLIGFLHAIGNQVVK